MHGLSTRASLAVHRVEHLGGSFYLHPGATERALQRYREFLRPPGRRPLYPRESSCDCTWCSFDDVRHARDVLEEVLERLPERARGELARLVRRLDTEFLRRTLQDPFAHRRRWRIRFWWYRRLADRPGWGDAPDGRSRRRLRPKVIRAAPSAVRPVRPTGTGVV